MIRIVWSTISSVNNCNYVHIIIYYISTIAALALGLKNSYTDQYLSSESENDDSYCIFSIQKQCKIFLLFLAFYAMPVYLY